MKRKYLSALLMGTLTVASMSTFTSCKDYDDDISNLQGQIDKLASADELKQKVSELQALISANQSGISSLQSELAKKTTLDEVKAVLANYATNENVTKEANEIVNAAIKALQDKDIAELKTAIEAAQKTADQAVKDAADAKAEILKTLEDYALKSDVEDVRDAANTAIEAVKSENTQAINAAKTEILEKLQDYATKEALNGVAEAAKAAVEAAKADNATKLAEAVSALETKIAAAKSTADEAKAKAGENAAAILALANTTTTANNALTQANANKTAIDNALKTLGTGFNEQNTVAAAIQAINGQLTAEKTGLTGLDGRLSAIESVLNGVKDDDTKLGLATKVTNIENKLKDIIGQYSTMVTDVQLYNFAPGSSYGTAGVWNYGLTFIQATEQANVFPGNGVADAQFTFEKGKYFAGEDSLLVRVSPVNAELATSNISLMNSQGQELNDLIEVTDAHRYNGLISSRASNLEKTGLWVVKFRAKDLGDAFKAAATVKVGTREEAILYSVAVKNTYTTDKENTRRVTSEYGVKLASAPANHAYDFTVNNKPIDEINNRYNYTDVEELVWKDNNKPATTVITKGDKANAVNRPSANNDDRHDKDILAVEKGGNIVIDFTKTENASDLDFGVKGFYVTLDEKYALESAPSEINAWNSYSYEKVGYKKNGTTYQPAKLFTGNKGIIKINDMGNVKGDVIGFRVYAVNYDGTLTDPDGRAFYVAVGDAKVDMTIPATTVSIDMNTANAEYPQFVSPKVAVDFSKYDFDAATDYTWVAAKDKTGATPTDFTVKYFKANGTETTELSKDVKAVQFVLTAPNQFIDGETYTVSTTLKKNIAGATAEVGTVTASFKKVMPTEAPKFSYRDGFDKFEYIIPTDDYTVNAANAEGKYTNKGGQFNFRNILIINNNVTAWNGVDLFTEGVFNFNVANGTYKTENDKNVLTNAKATASEYILNVKNLGANLVDNETERTITAEFVYKNISKRQIVNAQNQPEWKTDQPYPIASASSEKIVYCSWMKTFDIAANGGYHWTGKAATYKKDGTVDQAAIPAANVVTWSQDPTITELDLAKVEAKVADLKVIPSSVAGTVKGTNLKAFFDSKVIALVKGTYGTVWTTSTDGKQINPYFRAALNNNGEIVLIQSNQTTIPSNVKGGLIHFTVRDCFGNLKAIQLPFVIKMPEVTARKH